MIILFMTTKISTSVRNTLFIFFFIFRRLIKSYAVRYASVDGGLRRITCKIEVSSHLVYAPAVQLCQVRGVLLVEECDDWKNLFDSILFD
jgi:hypothetical protein